MGRGRGLAWCWCPWSWCPWPWSWSPRRPSYCCCCPSYWCWCPWLWSWSPGRPSYCSCPYCARCSSGPTCTRRSCCPRRPCCCRCPHCSSCYHLWCRTRLVSNGSHSARVMIHISYLSKENQIYQVLRPKTQQITFTALSTESYLVVVSKNYLSTTDQLETFIGSIKATSLFK